MVRFQCIHCGERIAVPDDHMDRLAQCPECGGVTHPLAKHIAAAPTSENAKTSAAQSAADPEESPGRYCDNCRTALGKLQKPFEWKGHLVCGPCHRKLSQEQEPSKPASASLGVAASMPKRVEAKESSRSSIAAVPMILAPADPKAPKLPSEFTLIVRTACIGLVVTAVALYVIVSILQSLGYLFIWGGVIVVLITAIYWVRRGVLAIRRRIGIGKAADA